MGIKKMQGTSAHLEYIVPKDKKRKTDCIYHNKGICNCSKYQTYLGKCVGRLYCDHFNDNKQALLAEDKHEYIFQNSKKVTKKERNKELVNKKYKLRDLDDNKIRVITFVKAKEQNEEQDYISITSTIADSIKGRLAGGIIKINKRKYRILSIS